MTKEYKKALAIAGIVGLVLAGGGGIYALMNSRLSESSSNSSISTSSSNSSGSVNVSNDNTEFDWSNLPTTEVTLGSSKTEITKAGTYILTGETSAGVSVNVSSEENVRIVLKNATIKSSNTPAIYVENAGNVVIQLESGTTNVVEDGSIRADETLDGAIFSHDDLFITGDGSLNIVANFADGIVSKDDLTILSGKITIKSADDAIRGKDSVKIQGGEINITAKGDGIKSTEDADASKGYTYISGGKITISSGDDAIKGVTSVVIDGGEINIANSVEGIEATNVTINGGKINIYATDDGINASSDGLGGDVFIKIAGGELTIKMASGDTDALDSNGNLIVSGGTIDITAQSAFDFDGTVSFTGGDVTVNGSKVSTIVNSMMGGGGRMR